MTKRLNFLHKIVGVITVLIFVATGVLMRLHFSVVYEANHLVRMMFRSIHIYILLAGLLNVAIGTYMLLSAEKRKRTMQAFGSICLLVAPALPIGAFFYEPIHESFERRVTQGGILLLLVGTLSHMLGASGTREA